MKREVKDSVVWMDSRNEVFSIESFYSILRSRHAILSPIAIILNSWLPSKACFFFLHGKLVTTKCWPWIIFRKRGWVLANRYVLCKCEEKSIDHILIHCHSKGVMAAFVFFVQICLGPFFYSRGHSFRSAWFFCGLES